jgi:pectate lyase
VEEEAPELIPRGVAPSVARGPPAAPAAPRRVRRLKGPAMSMLHSLVAAALLAACSNLSAQATRPSVPAFPGAEGFGAVSTGGRGGAVVRVTNLDDDGPGSLREALRGGHRTVVFDVSGTIHLQSRLTVSQPHVTIAGQTAPGDGIALAGHELFIAHTHDVIVRFLRVRPGDVANKEHDALTIWNARRVIIDHCSLSWSTDSLNDVVKGSGEITVQWSLLAEPLNRSVHVKGAHAYATGWDGRDGGASYHHNLIAHAASRTPRIEKSEGDILTDVRNNVIYNWGFGGAYGGEHAKVNFADNYFRAGPDSKRVDRFFYGITPATRLFVAGNVMDAPDMPEQREKIAAINADSRAGVDVSDPSILGVALLTTPHPAAAVTTRPAAEAYELVLERVGAVRPKRDAVDARIVADVRSRGGKIIDSQADVGGWPTLQSAPPKPDRDGDGMPDEWESRHRLDPDDPADGARIDPASGYTPLERYLAELAEFR